MKTQSIPPALVVKLRARNIKTAVVHYSGGNDDGGCDDVQLTRDDGTTAHINDAYVSTASGGFERDRMNNVIADGTRVVHQMVVLRDGSRHYYYEPATAEQITDFELVDELCKPVNDRYGSWAGEFSAHGTLTYDVGTRILQIEAWETTYTEAEAW